MPIYAYRCTTCGHAKDVLQKVADPLLTDCPACGARTLVKQVTAAGFQLKGSGWYVTDFRGGNAAAGKGQGEGESADKAADGAADKAADPGTTNKPAAPAPATESGKAPGKPADKADAKRPGGADSAGSAPAVAPAPAPTTASPPGSGG